MPELIYEERRERLWIFLLVTVIMGGGGCLSVGQGHRPDLAAVSGTCRCTCCRSRSPCASSISPCSRSRLSR